MQKYKVLASAMPPLRKAIPSDGVIHFADYSFSVSADGSIYQLSRMNVFFETHNEKPPTFLAFFTWAVAEEISPGYILRGYRLMVDFFRQPASPDTFDMWAAYTIRYLGKEQGLIYLEEELGCSLSDATDKDKLWVFNPLKPRALAKTASLEDFRAAGVTEVMFSCSGPSGACRRHDCHYVSIKDAFAFERIACEGCAHRWFDYTRHEGDHLYTLSEMDAAGKYPTYTDRYWELNGKPPLIEKGKIPEETAFKMIEYALHDFGHYNSEADIALAHRIAGEIYLALRMDLDAAEQFRAALRHNPRVGVKRKLTKLERESEMLKSKSG